MLCVSRRPAARSSHMFSGTPFPAYPSSGSMHCYCGGRGKEVTDQEHNGPGRRLSEAGGPARRKRLLRKE